MSSVWVERAGRRETRSSPPSPRHDPRSLYFLHDPELMIAGDIIPPSCYLDAIEILRRQYLAFLLDQAAQVPRWPHPGAGQMPRTIGQLASTGLQAGGWMSVILDAGKSPEMVARFVSLFGRHLDTQVAVRLGSWAASDMRPFVDQVIGPVARPCPDPHQPTRSASKERGKDFDGVENPSPDEVETHGRLVAELRYVAGRITGVKRQDTLGGPRGARTVAQLHAL